MDLLALRLIHDKMKAVGRCTTKRPARYSVPKMPPTASSGSTCEG